MAKLCQDKGVGAIAVQADVSEFVQAKEMANRAAARFGGIDLLVCNAGIWEGAPIEEMTEEVWNKVINTNLKSSWATTKACVPSMKKRPMGSIVMVSSTSGQRGEANYSNYSASKGGQISFTKAMASELCPKIRVNCRRSGLDRDGDGAAGVRRRGLQAERPANDPAQPLGGDGRYCAVDLLSLIGLGEAHNGRDPERERRLGPVRIVCREEISNRKRLKVCLLFCGIHKRNLSVVTMVVGSNVGQNAIVQGGMNGK